MTRPKSRFEQEISRHMAVAAAYRKHSESPRRRELAAEELGIDYKTFREWEAAARRMAFIPPNE